MMKNLVFSFVVVIWFNQIAMGQSLPTPLVHFDFNQSGSSYSNRGSLSMNGDIVGGGASGVAGSGVSGQSWDRAFDNSATPVMSDPNYEGRVQMSQALTSLNGASQLTITGWYKNVSVIPIGSHTTHLVFSGAPSGVNDGFQVRGSFRKDNISVYNDVTFIMGSNGFSQTVSYNPAEEWRFREWTFFAVTWQQNISTTIYRGDAASIYRTTLFGPNPSGLNNVNTPGQIGNFANTFNDNPLDGFMDDVRIYDSALSTAQIESVRLAAFAPVPEPSTIGFFGVGLIGLAVRMKLNRDS
jgi:hypothetical protein